MSPLNAVRNRLSRGRAPTEGRLVAGLSQRSQAELKEIEADERANESRPKVLAKLRYLRGSEPVEGYDKLEGEEVDAALDGAQGGRREAARE